MPQRAGGRAKDKSVGSVLSFLLSVGPGDHTQARLAWQGAFPC